MDKSLAKTFFEGLNEKERRLYAGLRAQELGYYGVAQVAQELGIHPHTVRAGQKQLAELSEPSATAEPCQRNQRSQRIRRAGGGRKKKSISNRP